MTKNIYAALAKAQSEMGKALKESANPHFRSKYADLGNVMDACLPALNANGIAVVQPFVPGELGHVVKTILYHESGESIECSVPLLLGKQDMQGLGSAITYARRYGLMSMAGIAPEDDDGNAAAKAAPNKAQQAQSCPLAATTCLQSRIRTNYCVCQQKTALSSGPSSYRGSSTRQKRSVLISWFTTARSLLEGA